MKATIKYLKKLTEHRSDTAFGEFLGFTKKTIGRAKNGKTKLHIILPMLFWLISRLSKKQLKEFLEEFKHN